MDSDKVAENQATQSKPDMEVSGQQQIERTQQPTKQGQNQNGINLQSSHGGAQTQSKDNQQIISDQGQVQGQSSIEQSVTGQQNTSGQQINTESKQGEGKASVTRVKKEKVKKDPNASTKRKEKTGANQDGGVPGEKRKNLTKKQMALQQQQQQELAAQGVIQDFSTKQLALPHGQQQMNTQVNPQTQGLSTQVPHPSLANQQIQNQNMFQSHSNIQQPGSGNLHQQNMQPLDVNGFQAQQPQSNQQQQMAQQQFAAQQQQQQKQQMMQQQNASQFNQQMRPQQPQNQQMIFNLQQQANGQQPPQFQQQQSQQFAGNPSMMNQQQYSQMMQQQQSNYQQQQQFQGNSQQPGGQGYDQSNGQYYPASGGSQQHQQATSTQGGQSIDMYQQHQQQQQLMVNQQQQQQQQQMFEQERQYFIIEMQQHSYTPYQDSVDQLLRMQRRTIEKHALEMLKMQGRVERKAVEPKVTANHWDYCLAEMQNMAFDVHQESIGKKLLASKIAKEAQGLMIKTFMKKEVYDLKWKIEDERRLYVEKLRQQKEVLSNKEQQKLKQQQEQAQAQEKTQKVGGENKLGQNQSDVANNQIQTHLHQSQSMSENFKIDIPTSTENQNNQNQVEPTTNQPVISTNIFQDQKSNFEAYLGPDINQDDDDGMMLDDDDRLNSPGDLMADIVGTRSPGNVLEDKSPFARDFFGGELNPMQSNDDMVDDLIPDKGDFESKVAAAQSIEDKQNELQMEEKKQSSQKQIQGDKADAENKLQGDEIMKDDWADVEGDKDNEQSFKDQDSSHQKGEQYNKQESKQSKEEVQSEEKNTQKDKDAQDKQSEESIKYALPKSNIEYKQFDFDVKNESKKNIEKYDKLIEEMAFDPIAMVNHYYSSFNYLKKKEQVAADKKNKDEQLNNIIQDQENKNSGSNDNLNNNSEDDNMFNPNKLLSIEKSTQIQKEMPLITNIQSTVIDVLKSNDECIKQQLQSIKLRKLGLQALRTYSRKRFPSQLNHPLNSFLLDTEQQDAQKHDLKDITGNHPKADQETQDLNKPQTTTQNSGAFNFNDYDDVFLVTSTQQKQPQIQAQNQAPKADPQVAEREKPLTQDQKQAESQQKQEILSEEDEDKVKFNQFQSYVDELEDWKKQQEILNDQIDLIKCLDKPIKVVDFTEIDEVEMENMARYWKQEGLKKDVLMQGEEFLPINESINVYVNGDVMMQDAIYNDPNFQELKKAVFDDLSDASQDEIEDEYQEHQNKYRQQPNNNIQQVESFTKNNQNQIIGREQQAIIYRQESENVVLEYEDEDGNVFQITDREYLDTFPEITDIKHQKIYFKKTLRTLQQKVEMVAEKEPQVNAELIKKSFREQIERSQRLEKFENIINFQIDQQQQYHLQQLTRYNLKLFNKAESWFITWYLGVFGDKWKLIADVINYHPFTRCYYRDEQSIQKLYTLFLEIHLQYQNQRGWWKIRPWNTCGLPILLNQRPPSLFNTRQQICESIQKGISIYSQQVQKKKNTRKIQIIKLPDGSIKLVEVKQHELKKPVKQQSSKLSVGQKRKLIQTSLDQTEIAEKSPSKLTEKSQNQEMQVEQDQVKTNTVASDHDLDMETSDDEKNDVLYNQQLSENQNNKRPKNNFYLFQDSYVEGDIAKYNCTNINRNANKHEINFRNQYDTQAQMNTPLYYVLLKTQKNYGRLEKSVLKNFSTIFWLGYLHKKIDQSDNEKYVHLYNSKDAGESIKNHRRKLQFQIQNEALIKNREIRLQNEQPKYMPFEKIQSIKKKDLFEQQMKHYINDNQIKDFNGKDIDNIIDIWDQNRQWFYSPDLAKQRMKENDDTGQDKHVDFLKKMWDLKWENMDSYWFQQYKKFHPRQRQADSQYQSQFSGSASMQSFQQNQMSSQVNPNQETGSTYSSTQHHREMRHQQSEMPGPSGSQQQVMMGGSGQTQGHHGGYQGHVGQGQFMHPSQSQGAAGMNGSTGGPGMGYGQGTEHQFGNQQHHHAQYQGSNQPGSMPGPRPQQSMQYQAPHVGTPALPVNGQQQRQNNAHLQQHPSQSQMQSGSAMQGQPSGSQNMGQPGSQMPNQRM